MRLEGNVAIVTGAGQGIGRGIALRLAQEGADLAIFEINPETCKAVAEEVKTIGRRGLPLAIDITNREAVRKTVGQVVGELGRVDILVNNAGGTPMKNFMDLDPATWDKLIALNFVGALNCTRAVLDHMVRQKYGRIISITSDAARIGTPQQAVYAGCKGAIVSFSKSLAAEVAAYGVTVNCIAPATTDTPTMRATMDPETAGRRAMANPMKRFGKPEDIANAVAFFAAKESEYITGQIISVNGGIVRVG